VRQALTLSLKALGVSGGLVDGFVLGQGRSNVAATCRQVSPLLPMGHKSQVFSRPAYVQLCVFVRLHARSCVHGHKLCYRA